MKVTDEMVEAACLASRENWGDLHHTFVAKVRENMRAALEAALRAQPSEPQGVVYQQMAECEDGHDDPNLWMDVSRETFERLRARPDIRSRIVYTVPAGGDAPRKYTGPLTLCDLLSDDTAPAGNAGGDTEKGRNDPSWSLFDRVDFALRDAGFDYDEAARIAHLASTPQPDEPVAVDIDCDEPSDAMMAKIASVVDQNRTADEEIAAPVAQSREVE